METRLRKEFRLLLTPWVLALLLATTTLWWRPGPDETAARVFGLACFALGMVLLAVAAFGKEFSHGTFLSWLCQPVSRAQLWLEKAGVLALAMVSVFLVFSVSIYCSLGGVNSLPAYIRHPVIGWAVLVSFTALGGGLSLTLLSREMISSIWLTVILPVALGLTLAYARQKWFPTQSPATWWGATLVVYSAVICLASPGLFLRYQDTQRLRDRTLYPFRLRLRFFRRQAAGPSRPRGSTAAMFWKELHLQQINFICSVVFLLLRAPAFVPDTLWKSSEWKGVVETLRLISWLVLALIPLLAGAVAICEERRLGLLEWQFSLPTSRLRQFLTKLFATYLLGLFLGALLPWLVDGLVWAYTGYSSFGNAAFERMALGSMAVFAVVATTLGLYASSLSKNLVQSLTLAGGLVVAVAAVIVAVFVRLFGRYSPSPLVLGGWLAAPMLFILLLVLSYRNCARAVVGLRGFLADAPILGAALLLVSLLTLGVWGRAWELVLPAPQHSVGAPVAGKVEPRIAYRPSGLIVLLQDGTLYEWVGGTGASGPGFDAEPKLVGNRSQWILADQAWSSSVAIKADGTLWMWGTVPIDGGKFARFERDPVRVGGDSDWARVACGQDHALALKRDGSLWAWGANHHGQLGDGTKTNRTVPVHVGQDNDWMAIAAGSHHSVAVKKDGSLWQWGELLNYPGYTVERADWTRLSPTRIGTDTNWFAVFCGNHVSSVTSMAVGNDGSLWAWGALPRSDGRSYSLCKEPMPAAGNHHWTKAAPSFGGSAAIRSDGTLWIGMLFSHGLNSWGFRTRDGCVELSDRKDWIAVTVSGDTVLALTADGRLWNWGFQPGENPVIQSLLIHSRWPRLVADLGNAETK